MLSKLKKNLVRLFAPGDERNPISRGRFGGRGNLFKILALGAVIGIGIAFLPAHQAHANVVGDLFGWLSDAVTGGISAIVSKVFYFLIYLMATFAGIFVAIVIFFIEIVLAMNATVVNSSLVQIGFSTVLSVANLGFVLGIIIVALATILRRESYGVKSILWKLVIMAIMVNFILVIAAPIIGFANGMTNYFLNAFPGGGSGLVNPNTGGVSVGGWTAYNKFADGMAGLFEPQALIAPENSSSSVVNVLNEVQDVGGGISGQVLGGLINLVMAAVCLVLMMIVLIVFLVMLIIRYIYLAVLLIIAPFAWMLWIFPKTSSYFSKWWDKFIKQAFFPPITMFFLWLVIKVGNQLTGPFFSSMQGQTVNGGNNGMGVFLQKLGFAFSVTALGSVLNSLLVIGLMMAGLTMGMKLSTEGSALAQKAVNGVKNSLQGYAGKQGKKVGRAAYQKEFKLRGKTLSGQRLTDRLSRSKLYGVSALGRGLSKATEEGGKNLVTDAAKGVSGSGDKIANELQGRMGTEEVMARLTELQKRGELFRLNGKKIGGTKTLDEYLANNKLFNDYGQQKLMRDLSVSVGSDATVRDARQALREGKTTMIDEKGLVGEKGSIQDSAKILSAASEKFAASLGTADIGKMELGAMFGEFPEPTEGTPNPTVHGLNKQEFERQRFEMMKGIAVSAPYLVPTILGKIQTHKNLNTAKDTLTKAITQAQAEGKMQDPQLVEKLKHTIDKAMANKLMYYGGAAPGTEESETAAATPPPAQPPPRP